MSDNFHNYFHHERKPSPYEQNQALRSKLATVNANDLTPQAFAIVQRMIEQGPVLTEADRSTLQGECERLFPDEFKPEPKSAASDLLKRIGGI